MERDQKFDRTFREEDVYEDFASNGGKVEHALDLLLYAATSCRHT